MKQEDAPIRESEKEFTFEVESYFFTFQEKKWEQYTGAPLEDIWMISSIEWRDGRKQPLPKYLQDFLENPEAYEKGDKQDFFEAMRRFVERNEKQDS